MNTIDISVTNELNAFISQQASNRGLTAEGYLLELIQADQKRVQVSELLEQGVESPKAVEAANEYVKSVRDSICR